MTGDVTVSGQARNSSSPLNLFATIYVTFTSNSGDLDLLVLSIDESSSSNPDYSVSTRVKETSKGSLIAEIQDITLTIPSNATFSSSNFMLIFPRDIYKISKIQRKDGMRNDLKGWNEQYPQSSLIPCSTDDSDVATRLMTSITGIGLVNVTSTTSSNADLIIKTWSITFLTYGADIHPLIIVSSLGTTDPAVFSVLFVPFSLFVPLPTHSTLQVLQRVNGTETVNGYFHLNVSSTESSSQLTRFSSRTGEIACDSTSYSLKNALEKLSSIASGVEVKTLDRCSMEGRCVWVFNLTLNASILPVFTPSLEHLKGTDVRVYVSMLTRGSIFDSDMYSMSIIRKNQSPIDSISLSYNAKPTDIANALNSLVARDNVVVTVKSSSNTNVDLHRTSYSIAITPSPVYDDESSNLYSTVGGNTEIDIRKTSDLPSIVIDQIDHRASSIHAVTVEEVDVSEVTSHASYLLSVKYPQTTVVNEVQSITCQSNVPLSRDGWMQSEKDPLLIALSFRNFTTTDIWIHSYVSPNLLPLCSDFNVTTGMPCSGDGSTVLEKLRSLVTVSGLNASTNSTTGRLCPEDGFVDNFNASMVFTTTFTFYSMNGKAIDGSVGDVPLLLLHHHDAVDTSLDIISISSPSVTARYSTQLQVVEVIKGFHPDVREVQLFSFQTTLPRFTPTMETNKYNSTANAGFYHLVYQSTSIVVSTKASEEVLAAAVAILLKIQDISSINVTKSIDSLSMDDGFVRYETSIFITFPTRFGRVSLLQVLPDCVYDSELSSVGASATIHQSALLPQQLNEIDYWEGSSCMPSYFNRFQTHRIVSGYTVLSGSFEMVIAGTHVSIPLSTMLDSLKQSLHSISTLSNTVVSTMSIPSTSLQPMELYVIDVSRTPSSSVSYPTIDTSGIRINYPQCAMDPSSDLSLTQYMLQLNRDAAPTIDCVFPFLHDSSLYSSCITSNDDSYSYCSIVYNLDNTASNGNNTSVSRRWGRCVPCLDSITSHWDFTLSLDPFSSEARWIGNIEQLNDVLSKLVYYPNAQSLYSNTMTDDGKEPLIPDYIVTIVTKDGTTDDAVEIEASLLIHLLNDAPQFICNDLMEDATSSSVGSACVTSLYTFEDEVLSIGSISIYDDSYPTAASQSSGLVGVNLSVLHGDLFLGSYKHIFFSSTNITGQLSFFGTIRDINIALSSLLYVPSRNWNSGI